MFIRQGLRTVINVGCAEGYYAIGMARAMPDSHIYAYDIDEEAQCLCRKMAKLNSVAERVTIRGGCDCAELNSLPLDGAR